MSAQAGAEIAKVVVKVVEIVNAKIQAEASDKEKRSIFTQDFIKEASLECPDHNIVIIHPPHTREGRWRHEHVEETLSGGNKIGFDVYFSRKGEPFFLENKGDGGYLNWAFTGYKRDGNQIWEESRLQIIQGISNDRCFLSCTEDGSRVDLWHTDDGSGRQRWFLKGLGNNEYNILVLEGVQGDKRYLSCTEDGSKVDLWHTDDGSGRQQWKFS